MPSQHFIWRLCVKTWVLFNMRGQANGVPSVSSARVPSRHQNSHGLVGASKMTFVPPCSSISWFSAPKLGSVGAKDGQRNVIDAAEGDCLLQHLKPSSAPRLLFDNKLLRRDQRIFRL